MRGDTESCDVYGTVKTITNTITLPVDCLQKLVTEEELRGDDKYFCARCNKKRNAVRRSSFSVLPKVLILHINRTSWRNGSKKVQTAVQFSSQLDISALARAPTHRGMYKLNSVVVHHGRSLTEGHYTAYGWNDYTKMWLHFNDHRVQPVSENQVESQQGTF